MFSLNLGEPRMSRSGFFLCLILLLITCSASAAVTHPDRLEFLAVNDIFTFGITSNPDDLRSFGFRVTIEYENGFYGQIQASGLTNQYDDPAEERRLDELAVTVGYALQVPGTDNVSFSITPGAGAVLYGNLGYAFIQRKFHTFFNLTEFDMTYDHSGKIGISPSASIFLASDIRRSMTRHPDTDFLIMTGTEGLYAPGYEAHARTYIKTGYETDSCSRLLVGLGYAIRHSFGTRPTHSIVSDFETGWEASLTGRIGAFSIGYIWNLSTLHGFSGIGFNFGKSTNRIWEGRDLVITHSAALPYPALSTAIRYYLDSNLSITARNMFFSIITTGAQPARENLSTWLGGLDYEWQHDFLPEEVTVFASVEAGVRRLFAAGYAGGISDFKVLISDYRFCGEVTGGIRLFQDGEIYWKGAAYGIETYRGDTVQRYQ